MTPVRMPHSIVAIVNAEDRHKAIDDAAINGMATDDAATVRVTSFVQPSIRCHMSHRANEA